MFASQKLQLVLLSTNLYLPHHAILLARLHLLDKGGINDQIYLTIEVPELFTLNAETTEEVIC